MKARILFTALSVAAAICSCSRSRYVVFQGYAQGGTYTVKADMAGASASYDEMADSIETILARIDASLSGYNKGSILSRRNAGEAVETDKYFDEVLALSEQYKEYSDGAFDVASAPLFDVWGFGFTSGSMPSEEEIASAMEECRNCKKLNFNAIAQGYTCDVVADYLHSVGIHNMLVDIGEIYCEGRNPSGQGWSIGIDTPIDGNNTPGATMSGVWVSDGSAQGVVTSGNYRKFYVRDGKKYAHTIDPRTGHPVTHNLLSATVVAPTAAGADALATFFMVIGFDEARERVLASPDIEACLITSDTTWFSPGFNHR